MPFDLHVEQGRLEPPGFQLFQQLVEGNIDRQRVFVATEYDPRNHAIAACLTSGALACPRPFQGYEIRDLSSHILISIIRAGILQGCMPA